MLIATMSVYPMASSKGTHFLNVGILFLLRWSSFDTNDLSWPLSVFRSGFPYGLMALSLIKHRNIGSTNAWFVSFWSYWLIESEKTYPGFCFFFKCMEILFSCKAIFCSKSASFFVFCLFNLIMVPMFSCSRSFLCMQTILYDRTRSIERLGWHPRHCGRMLSPAFFSQAAIMSNSFSNVSFRWPNPHWLHGFSKQRAC